MCNFSYMIKFYIKKLWMFMLYQVYVDFNIGEK